MAGFCRAPHSPPVLLLYLYYAIALRTGGFIGRGFCPQVAARQATEEILPIVTGFGLTRHGPYVLPPCGRYKVFRMPPNGPPRRASTP